MDEKGTQQLSDHDNGAQQNRASQAGPCSSQGKMRIDPLQLLTCLSILLNPKGGIKSIEEVQRVAGLMGKYSKKLVSKCIYLNILQATDEPLLEEFYKETGWNLVYSWLTEAVSTKNYPLADQILNLLHKSPVNVDRLKKNNTPIIVKELSKDCPHNGARSMAEKVVLRWKDLVRTCGNSDSSSDSQSLGSTLGLSNSPTNGQPSELPSAEVTEPLPQSASPPENIPSIETKEEPMDQDYVPSPKATRGTRGAKSTRGGSSRGRGRKKRGGATRGRGRGRGSSLSYADLLSEDVVDSVPNPVEQVKEEKVSLKLTIKGGNKILPQAKTRGTRRTRGAKKANLSRDSTDSDDNKPLSVIREECLQKTSPDPVNVDSVEGDVKEEPVKEIKQESPIIEQNDIVNKENSSNEVTSDIKDEEPVTCDTKIVKEMDNSDATTEPEVVENDSNKIDKNVKRSDSLKSELSSETESEVDSKKKPSESDGEKSKSSDDKKTKTASNHRDKVKDEHKDKKASSSDAKSKDRDRSRNKDSDKERSRDGERSKDRSSDKHRSSRDKHHHHHRHDKDRKDKDRSSSDKKNRDKDKRKDEDRKDRSKDHRKDQAEKDKDTLNKVKPLSTEGLAKIPRKNSSAAAGVSFLDALGSADSDASEVTKRPAVKTKSRGFRNTGLLDEQVKPPGVAGKRNIDGKSTSSLSSPNTITQKRPNETSPVDKRPLKISTTQIDRPGGIKLISPKRPSLADDGGFMAALTAAGDTTTRKKIIRKRKSSESDAKTDGPNSKNLKLDISKDSLEEGEEELASPLKGIADEVMEGEEKTEAKALLSPTSIKPTLNFYKETLKDDDEEESATKEKTEKESDKMEVESVEENEEGSPDPVNTSDVDLNGNEEEEEKPPVPAPAHEEYEKVEVFFSKPTRDLKGAIIFHRSADRKKKSVQWKSDEKITEVFLFPMDENERVNVNTIKFNEMMMMEKANEKELLGKYKGDGGGGRFLHENFTRPSKCIDYFPYKLYPVHLPNPSTVIPGSKSRERFIQAQREHSTMAAFFNPDMLPDTPAEPDPEMVKRTEPIVIPKEDDGTGNFCDNRKIPWPEPLFGPPDFPFMGPGPNMSGPPVPPSGGHWVQGNHTVNKFDGPMFHGGNQVNFGPGGFPPSGGGGWNGPPEFVGPPGMMNGPPMIGQMIMGGPPMHGPPSMGPGAGMNMGGPPPGSGNQRFRRGGMRGDRGSWRGGPPSRRKCRHFIAGHCHNGSECKFLHSFND